ncbi:MAG TPA: O-antigen ligase family protein [Pyrinomonadaceae bacterium]|nr:O-antigen ligase family protein [Pyrinomonadaceae bacterium]
MDSPINEKAESAPAGEVPTEHGAARWLDRAITVWLFALAAAAPHSIAATQFAWGCGLILWAARFLFRPRPRLPRTPIDYALLGFFVLTVVSSLLSYDRATSVGKLRAASLFTIVYLVAGNVHGRRVLRLLALTLIISCMVNVLYTFGERVAGRGIRLEGVASNSPLRGATFVREDKTEDPTPIKDRDIVLEVDGRRVRSPEELAAALGGSNAGEHEAALVKIYRTEWMPVLKVPRGRLLAGATPLEQLGVSGWSRGREWRAAGLYGHYTTYAEALQLIASLALGLFIALRRKLGRKGVLLLVAAAGMGGALLLTVTRASWLAFLVSAFVIVLAGARSRRTIIALAACALPVIVAGLFVLQRQRNVSFLDARDQSISWRGTVWREGFDLLRSSPRHLLVGVGMDSIKTHWREWGLFDGGRLPVGHMHSTPLQLAVERGVPALLAWLILMAVYALMLLRLTRTTEEGSWAERGVVLGALGGLAGFVTSGTVHYNFGDSEVVMIFYFIMGLALVVWRLARDKGALESARQARVET